MMVNDQWNKEDFGLYISQTEKPGAYGIHVHMSGKKNPTMFSHEKKDLKAMMVDHRLYYISIFPFYLEYF